MNGERGWRDALRRLGEAAVAWDLGDDSIFLAEELVAQAWMLGESERLALALLVLAVAAAERQGSTRLPLFGDALGRRIGELCAAAQLDVEPARVVREIRQMVADPRPGLVSLIGRPGEDRPLIATREAVATHRLHSCEVRLAAFVRARRAAAPLEFDDGALAEVARSPVVLSDEQRAAVAFAASRALAVVSGGPGTGKTAICAALCRALVRNGVAPAGILLAAPTGKAAQRLGASVRGALAGATDEADRRLAAELPEARTLHRLLGYQPESGRFRHHAGAPLRGEIVIVDEASMVDLVLVEKLARALAPATRLVLFGDADQLPSVEAGAVLRDLASADACRLTRSYRMDESDPAGRAILEAARSVRAGRVGPWPSPDPAPVARLVDHWFESRISGGGRWALLARAVSRMNDVGGGGHDRELGELTRHLESSRMLSVTRRLRRGTEALNRHFHRRAAAALGIAQSAARFDFLPGEPIVVRENDHARALYNGDCGLVAAAGRGADGLRAVFSGQDGGWRVFPLAALRPRLELAYALTVHQSQGSEYDHVALVLPDADMPLATRELVYTALTRARRSIALFGSAEVLRAAVARSAERFSGL